MEIDIRNHVPWIVYKAKEWLDGFLNEEMNVFEWGSGSSTLYFCERVKKVVSIEHDREWFNRVRDLIVSNNIKNCDYFLIEPKCFLLAKFFPYNSMLYNSKVFSKYENCLFRGYVRKIYDYPDGFFDLVFVDGRARAACIKHAVKKIKQGGVLMLDNSERELYQREINRLKKFKHIDFFGHGPYIDNKWKTSIWFIE